MDRDFELKQNRLKVDNQQMSKYYLSLSRLMDFWLSGVCLPSALSSCFLSSSSFLSAVDVAEVMEAAEAGRVWLAEGPGVELSEFGGAGPERFLIRLALTPFLLSRSSSVSA